MSPHASVSDWRDKVSEDLGFIKGTLSSVDSRLDKINGTIANHEERIDCLEDEDVAKNAVKKFWAGVWALVGGTVVVLCEKLIPVIAKVFK